MANYTQTNIYRKQMKELGLNTMQYAKLLDVPYEVVKDMIYDKEGDYSMEVKNLLRNTMFKRHQEIENNFEQSKIKAMHIKLEDKNVSTATKRKWYENEYTPDLLCQKLNIKTRAEFERNYDILIDDKRASKWFYVNMTGKRNYDNHEISDKVFNQFVEQLYDIIVNDNGEKYKRNEPTETKIFPSQRKPIVSKNYKNKYFKWFRDFDIQAYMKENNISKNDLAKELNIGISAMHKLYYKQYYSKRTLQKLYNYMKQHETTRDYKEIASDYLMQNDEETEVLDLTETPSNDFTNDITDKCPCENVSQPDSNEMLRKILINRLTDEEKELIRIFGGKLD